MGGGEWRIASGRRRRPVLRSPCWSNELPGWPSSKSRSCDDDGGALEETSRRLEAAVQRAVQRVEQSAFYNALRRQIVGFQGGGGLKSRLGCKSAAAAPPVELVVYGVGSIEESEASRCQLALALLLRRDVEAIGAARVYDPVLSAAEVRAIQRLGCLPIAAAEQGRRRAAPTLFFMPHCGAGLYDSVLEANWASLSSIAILGNSFYGYVQQCRGGGGGAPTAPPLRLLDGARRAEEYVVMDMGFPATSAFNDMSWHFFPESNREPVTSPPRRPSMT